ncbi:GxxExxY protein [Pararhodonellum marinum]|uniref:GxxExxY protein n=1 Tax=Pararhodonellum marinum TaxID=2755358 RepID=UPI00188EB76D|nr:GxxExxY protein [Pararhodonellum marinum]
MENSKKYLDKLTFDVIGAAIEVHKNLGPGLLEKVYQKCLARELNLRGINFIEQVKMPFNYKGESLDLDLMFDFYIENCLVVEIKAVNELTHLYHAQTLAYMKLLEAPKGILINFNVTNIFHEGQKTFVNEIYKNLL